MLLLAARGCSFLRFEIVGMLAGVSSHPLLAAWGQQMHVQAYSCYPTA